MAESSLYENIPTIDNSFTVKIRSYNNYERLSPHWHEHIELLLFTKGKCDFICNGEHLAVGQSDFLIINSTEIHSYVASEKVDLICVLLYPEFFSDINFPNIKLQNIIRDDDFIKECIADMNAEYLKNDIGSDMMLKSHALRLMAYLVRNFSKNTPSKKEIALHSVKLERLNAVLKYISSNYGEKITTKQLAEMAFLNENHFCRFFKKEVGKTVTQYIGEYRIEKAAVLLTATDKSITDIASEVGFDDINYFSRTFKKIKGTSPSDYRKAT